MLTLERARARHGVAQILLSIGKKGILVVEINAGQMVQDVRLAVNGSIKVEHFGRLGGIVPDPEEIVNALKEKLL